MCRSASTSLPASYGVNSPATRQNGQLDQRVRFRIEARLFTEPSGDDQLTRQVVGPGVVGTLHAASARVGLVPPGKEIDMPSEAGPAPGEQVAQLPGARISGDVYAAAGSIRVGSPATGVARRTVVIASTGTSSIAVLGIGLGSPLSARSPSGKAHLPGGTGSLGRNIARTGDGHATRRVLRA